MENHVQPIVIYQNTFEKCLFFHYVTCHTATKKRTIYLKIQLKKKYLHEFYFLWNQNNCDHAKGSL